MKPAPAGTPNASTCGTAQGPEFSGQGMVSYPDAIARSKDHPQDPDANLDRQDVKFVRKIAT
jgi:hypothetical protein